MIGRRQGTPSVASLKLCSSVKSPLEKASPRFISVQLPEGPNAAQIQDKQGRVTWSAIFHASPGVVNVIGPNY